MPESKSGTTALSELSAQLAGAVETASQSIVAIHARRRIPSSGIVWRDGVVVSASHTVRRDEDIRITLPDGNSTSAEIIGRDSATDLIALRLTNVPTGMPRVAAKAAADAARVGTLALAIGRPGRDVSASFGIVSAVIENWRSWQGGGGGARLDRILRLDLAIYDGFSGGPLVDASGALLGLNNSALGRGAAMAMPTAAVERVLDELLERGHVRRPYIGVAVQPVVIPAALVRRLGIAHDSALLVLSVGDASPADRAGLFVGDALLEANGQPLRHPTDLLDALANTANNASLEITLLRGGEVKRLTVTPGDRGARS